MVPYGSQGLPLLIDVRSDEKTARRAVVLARNADEHGRAQDARARSSAFLQKTGRNAAFRGSARSLRL